MRRFVHRGQPRLLHCTIVRVQDCVSRRYQVCEWPTENLSERAFCVGVIDRVGSACCVGALLLG